jgi:hypothetical protein
VRQLWTDLHPPSIPASPNASFHTLKYYIIPELKITSQGAHLRPGVHVIINDFFHCQLFAGHTAIGKNKNYKTMNDSGSEVKKTQQENFHSVF